MTRALYIAALSAVLLSAAAIFLDVRPARSCTGTPGESDFLDNPGAYVCDVSSYELVVYGATAVLVPIALILALVGMIRR